MTNAEARFNKSHVRKVYACLAVTCHLHFLAEWPGFLRATVVTRGWNGYRNKSQHRKSTLEKKILPQTSRDSNPRPFNHESGALTTELSLPPKWLADFLSLPFDRGVSPTWLVWTLSVTLIYIYRKQTYREGDKMHHSAPVQTNHANWGHGLGSSQTP